MEIVGEAHHFRKPPNYWLIGGLGPGGLGFESGYPLSIPIPFIFGDPIGIQTTGTQTTNYLTTSWYT